MVSERKSCIWKVGRSRIKSFFTQIGYKQEFAYHKIGRSYSFDNLESSKLGEEQYSMIKLDMFQIFKQKPEAFVDLSSEEVK